MGKGDFLILRRLGYGCFGEVYLVQEKKTGFLAALKIMEKKKILKENYLSQAIREAKIQNHIRHPNIAELYAVFDDTDFLYLLMELCPDESLFNLIRRSHKIDEEDVQVLVKGIVEGVKALHSQTIIHRDIKPENIMMSFTIPKITDFGWAVHCGPDGKVRATLSGSPLYHSPELVERKGYDEKVDIWSIGILTYECLLGVTPFKVYSLMNLHRIVEDQLTFPAYAEVSDSAKNFIAACLAKDSGNRPTAFQLLSHQFLKVQQNDQSGFKIQSIS